MGTYSDEDPNASIGEKLANSIGKIVKSVTGYEGPAPVTANAQEEPQVHNTDESNSSTEASNTGPAGQSTDAYNKY